MCTEVKIMFHKNTLSYKAAENSELLQRDDTYMLHFNTSTYYTHPHPYFFKKAQR